MLNYSTSKRINIKDINHVVLPSSSIRLDQLFYQVSVRSIRDFYRIPLFTRLTTNFKCQSLLLDKDPDPPVEHVIPVVRTDPRVLKFNNVTPRTNSPLPKGPYVENIIIQASVGNEGTGTDLFYSHHYVIVERYLPYKTLNRYL